MAPCPAAGVIKGRAVQIAALDWVRDLTGQSFLIFRLW